ncbi:hypothetical protein UFOVP708_24 [uncultured Caudovirales phage]|uniref:Uncharacterized protein n=1 Tax=uncultured Caudovirales phage TaxID=2100421 RepID=A0A6J5NN04_9CAUD|nr:hypothetical protein UFOVP708_24 [uncultured Caudovirales phage]
MLVTIEDLRSRARELAREANILSGLAFSLAENTKDDATRGKAAYISDLAADTRESMTDWLAASN